ncbi:MAG TPA: IS630 family transposase [Gemmataceae bacterium]|nr:IS630 family transposase [Gemmataceae bacterium]
MSSIRLTPAARRTLLDHYRRSADPEVRLRAQILLLLAAGYPWVTVSAVLFCSLSAISRWRRRFEAEGVDAVFRKSRGRPRSGCHAWAALVVRWVLTLSPVAFRFARSRWSCEAVAVVLRDDARVRVGRETVRRWLRSAGLVWRRPRPTIRPKDPDRGKKLAALRALLHGLPADETAVFMDEVDVNLNPKVGCLWMRRGQQAAVETPGTNEKRYLAGSIHWRTGRVILTKGRVKEGRGAALFLRHLDDLRRAFRHYKVIHVICDNAGFHKPDRSKAVKKYLGEWSGRVVVHYLPTYSPDCNPVERVWWRLHEAVTRNHRCRTMDELLDLTFDWFATRTHFRAETDAYREKPEKQASLRHLAGGV